MGTTKSFLSNDSFNFFGSTRPGDNLNPDEMDYEDDLEIIEGEEAYREERQSGSIFPSYFSTARPSGASNGKLNWMTYHGCYITLVNFDLQAPIYLTLYSIRSDTAR